MRECVFCRSTNLTLEHVFGDWIVKLIGNSEFNWRHYRTDSGTRETDRWSSRSITLKAKFVCKSCNDGWMSDIESRASPAFSGMILDGDAVSLPPQDVNLLAVFAFKCAVIANHMSPNGSPFFSRYIRHQFRLSRTIPPGVQMWVAGFSGKYAFSGLYNAYYLEPGQPNRLGDLEFLVFTYLAGRLVFQVLSPRWKKVIDVGRPLPLLCQSRIWEMASSRFWPLDGKNLSWPPPRLFDDESLSQFLDRWKLPIKVFE